MKTPDDPINRALRTSLQRKFDDFEAQPDARLEVNVFDHLKNLSKSETTRQLLSMILLITFVLTTTVTDDSVSMPESSLAFSRKAITPIAQNFLVSIEEAQNKETRLGKNISDKNQKTVRQFSIESSENSSIDIINLGIQIGAAIKEIKYADTNGDKNTDLPVERIGMSNIDPIAGTTFIQRNLFTRRKIAAHPDLLANDLPLSRKNPWKALIAITPTNTFQTLTVNPQPDVTYQNFQLPAPVSAQSIGYKISGGIEKGGFQFLMTYGQFRQSVSYEVATDEFLVEPTSANAYRVVRKGVAVESQNTFKMIGLAVKKRSVIQSGPFRNYFGNIGLEVSREVTHGQNLAWGNIGIGKELTLTNRTVLTVGPYLEYSFSKLLIPANQFQTQPYQVGISVGISYSRD